MRRRKPSSLGVPPREVSRQGYQAMNQSPAERYPRSRTRLLMHFARTGKHRCENRLRALDTTAGVLAPTLRAAPDFRALTKTCGTASRNHRGSGILSHHESTPSRSNTQVSLIAGSRVPSSNPDRRPTNLVCNATHHPLAFHANRICELRVPHLRSEPKPLRLVRCRDVPHSN